MRVPLDESLPRRLRGEFSRHTVETVTRRGWSGLGNGELLKTAAGRFDTLITADQNIEVQQYLRSLPLAVVMPVAGRITFEALRPLLSDVPGRLDRLEPRTLARVGS